MNTIPETTGTYVDFELPDAVRGMLDRRGIKHLYAHQAQALASYREGRDLMLATSTASGKSLVYNVAIGWQGLEERDAHALLLFPLKALARDQLRHMRADFATLPALQSRTAAIYDGDTPKTQRRKLRLDPPNVLLTTPDMLHAGILPFHAGWSEFFTRLRTIVIDECHIYRGILGSQVAHVLRRLLRIAAHYGAHPQIISCSATIGNPREFIRELTGRAPALIEHDGTPLPKQHFACVDTGKTAYKTAASVFVHAVRMGLRTLAFTQARRTTELLYRRVCEQAPELANRISSYRSGFLAEERREIETRLFSGDLLGVISTSALELGIDVGHLDLCILVGYPGSILSTRQRAGRVGRAREGLVILVPQNNALDRYIAQHSQELLLRSCEAATLDVANLPIATRQLSCAAAELPIDATDPWLEDPGIREALNVATRDGRILRSADGRQYFSARRQPARRQSLRASDGSYTIHRGQGAEATALGDIGAGRVQSECHEGATYLHHGQTYQVETLDFERSKIQVRGPLRVPYFTRAHSSTDIQILEISEARTLGPAWLRRGTVRIVTRTTHFERMRIRDNRSLGHQRLEMPAREFETDAMWLEVNAELAQSPRFNGGLHALEHAVLAMFPLFALCDRFDVSGASFAQHIQVDSPAVFFYDDYPGGVGLCRALYTRAERLFKATAQLVENCDCMDGCPGCIQSARCGKDNRPLDKKMALKLLNWIQHSSTPPSTKETYQMTETQTSNTSVQPLIFDIETQLSADEVGGWNNKDKMRVALAVIYDAERGEYETFLEDRVPELVDRLRKAQLVVGFNIRNFDYGVLNGYTDFDFNQLPTLDLLEDIHQKLGHRLSLNHVAEHTLGAAKSGDGLQSLEWFRNGEVDKVEAYCRDDVKLVRDLMRFAAEHGHILFQRRSGEVVQLPVSWPNPS